MKYLIHRTKFNGAVAPLFCHIFIKMEGGNKANQGAQINSNINMGSRFGAGAGNTLNHSILCHQGTIATENSFLLGIESRTSIYFDGNAGHYFMGNDNLSFDAAMTRVSTALTTIRDDYRPLSDRLAARGLTEVQVHEELHWLYTDEAVPRVIGYELLQIIPVGIGSNALGPLMSGATASLLYNTVDGAYVSGTSVSYLPIGLSTGGRMQRGVQLERSLEFLESTAPLGSIVEFLAGAEAVAKSLTNLGA